MSYKAITAQVHIGATVQQTVLNTAETTTINIPLSPVDRQIFVVTDLFITGDTAEPVAGTRSVVMVTVSKTDTGLANINNPDVIGQKRFTCYGGATEFSAIVDDIGTQMNTTGTKADHLMIIATDNAFLTVDSSNAAVQLYDAQCRLSGFFAKADSDTYNALVISEIGA